MIPTPSRLAAVFVLGVSLAGLSGAACGGETLSPQLDGGPATDGNSSKECSICSCPACLAGKCIASARTIAAEPAEAHALAIDGSDLYWTLFVGYGPDGGVIRHGTTAGDAPSTLASGYYLPVATTTNATSVLWASNNSPPIWRVAKTGGAVSTVVPNASASQRPAFTVDDTSIFWAKGGAVYRTPLVGGPSELLWSGAEAHGFVKDSSGVYFRTATNVHRVAANQVAVVAPSNGDGYGFMVLDDGAVYWSVVSQDVYKPQGAVFRASKAGGAPVALANGLDQLESMTIDGPWLYFSNDRLVLPPQGGPGRFYASIMRVPRNGGAIETVADCLQGPVDVRARAGSIYFTSGNGVSAIGPF